MVFFLLEDTENRKHVINSDTISSVELDYKAVEDVVNIHFTNGRQKTYRFNLELLRYVLNYED